MDTKTEVALADLSRGFRRIELPIKLGWHDLTTRYRRTKLGPLWLVLGTGIMVGGVGTVWSTIFNMNLADLFPYLAAGFIIWQLVAGAVIEGPTVFTTQVHVIRSIDLPLTFHVLRATMRNIFNFLHNMIIFVIVAVIFGIAPSWNSLWFFPAALIILCNLFWIGILLGLIGARFHDISPLVGSVMTLVFLLTPVMWKPEMMVGRSRLIVDLNPFAHFVEILRAPMLGVAPGLLAWGVSILITIVGMALTFMAMRAWCRHLPFWM